MTTLQISVKKCPICDIEMNIIAVRPNLCGVPCTYWELTHSCPECTHYSYIHHKVE